MPEGHYFFMGDNRDGSLDSRVLSEVGFVPEENLVGRAEILFYSTDGSAKLWEVWKWPFAMRFSRFGQYIVTKPGAGSAPDIEAQLGIRFADPTLLQRALTHRSLTGGHAGARADNQRLEWLGDRVLGTGDRASFV